MRGEGFVFLGGEFEGFWGGVFLGRLTAAGKKRGMVEASLRGALAKRKSDELFYRDLLDKYMGFYDVHERCISGIKEVGERGDAWQRSFLDLSAEARRVVKEMIAILTFLGLKLPEDKFGMMGDDDDL